MRLRWMRVVWALVLALLPAAMIVSSVGPASAQDGAAASSGLALPIYGPLGENEEDGVFQGSVSNLEFVEGDEGLVLTGLVNGIATIGEESIRITDEQLETPVEPSVAGAELAEDEGEDAEGEADADDSAGLIRTFSYQDENPTQPEPDPDSCDILFLDIQPITLNLLGLEVLTSRITLDVNAIPGDGNLLGNLLCSVAGLLDGLPDTLGDVTEQLNNVVSTADEALTTAQQDADGLGELPLFGTFEDESGETGTFQGTVSDLLFSEEDGETVVDGVLDGITNVGDTTRRLRDQPISSPVTPDVGGTIRPEERRGNGGQNNPNNTPTPAPTQANQDNPTQPEPDPDKCDILFLDIQPITLNLLGLEVLTSRITVDVNAIPGEGNLAGNLLCALAGLLDGTPDAVDDIVNQLNQIADEVGVASAEVSEALEEGTHGATDQTTDEETTVEETGTETADEGTKAPEPNETVVVSDPATAFPTQEPTVAPTQEGGEEQPVETPTATA
jgi:hypothetical protein